MADLMQSIDVYIAPTSVGDNLLLTNLTGHPTVVLPTGFRREGERDVPRSVTFTGNVLFLAVITYQVGVLAFGRSMARR